MNRFARLAMVGLICAAGGCASYYRVHDPTTGKDYYTTDVKQERGGAATLRDAKTGREVTVQNSEIEKISEEEYNQGRYAQPASPSQPETTTGQPQQKTGASGNPF